MCFIALSPPPSFLASLHPSIYLPLLTCLETPESWLLLPLCCAFVVERPSLQPADAAMTPSNQDSLEDRMMTSAKQPDSVLPLRLTPQ